MGKRRNKNYKNTTSSLINDGISISQKTPSDKCNNGKLCTVFIPNPDEILVFETYKKSHNVERVVGREYYMSSLCQVCKEEPKEEVECSRCRLLTYCSQQHRRDHWPVHSEICDAVMQLCRDRRVDHIMEGAQHLSPDQYRAFRIRNMTECERKVERSLEKWEREMFLFPKVCAICMKYKTNLAVCERCHVTRFCPEHQTHNHKDWCKSLHHFKNMIQDQAQSGVAFPSIPVSKYAVVLPKLQSMDDFFKEISKSISEMEYFELSDITTYPLTALYALCALEHLDLSTTDHLTIHIIGAESDFEIRRPEKWEYLVLHLIPGLKSLHIDFIGPELNVLSSDKLCSKLCSLCRKATKNVTFSFHNKLYHNLDGYSNLRKPNLICMFNPGLYRVTGFDGNDSWTPTIQTMVIQQCPVLITAYTHKEILMDVRTIESLQKIIILTKPQSNPFSSLKPSLNFVSDEDCPVIFKNSFYCIINTNEMCK